MINNGHSWHLEAEGSNVCGGGSIPLEQTARSPSWSAVCFDSRRFFFGAEPSHLSLKKKGARRKIPP
ncbi:MAG: hypothetical protein AABX01_01885 [Candidatus Micrarchaeota archaeon]